MGKAKTKKTEESFEKGFLNDLLKATDNRYAVVMDEDAISQTTGYISTGSLALNGLISADINKGIPNNRTIAIAGEESVGKTYVCLSIAKQAILDGYLVIFFDSENALEKDTLISRGIDPKKVMHIPVDTVEDVRGQMNKIITTYDKQPKKERPKLLIILDSLGNLSTRKEISDVDTDSDKKDMTRPAVIKSIFRVLSRKLAHAKIPFIVTNHVYTEINGGKYAKKILSGGCLTEKEQIIMSDGTYKSIKDVIIGDTVKTMFLDSEVINNFHYKKAVIKLTLDGGDTIECSQEHKFLVENGGDFSWKTAEELQENDEIVKM